MSHPIDAIAQSLTNGIAIRLREDFEEIKFCESPIERVLYLAMKSVLEPYPGIGFGFVRLDRIEDLESRIGDHERTVYVVPQFHIHPYRVDFLILARWEGGAWRKLVVECDGHDFHEKTKEQAARDKLRDRIIQAQGYQVFRFTGSEIWNNPVRCVTQIIGWWTGNGVSA